MSVQLFSNKNNIIIVDDEQIDGGALDGFKHELIMAFD